MKNKMKTIFPILGALLFLGIALSPGITAQEPVSKDRTLTIWMPGITEDDYRLQMEVTQEQVDAIDSQLDVFLGLVEAVKDENSLEGAKVTQSEWQDLKTSVFGMIDSIEVIVGEEFPDIDVKEYIEETILGFFNPFSWIFQRAMIFSVGRGVTWIPFYDYEAFLGVMLRPIFITHTLGFTAALHFNMLPPRAEYGDRLGIYRLSTIAFVGLFINFGDIAFDRVMGPVLCIGKGFNHLGEDFP